MSNGLPIAQPSLNTTARPALSPTKPFSWHNQGAAAATAAAAAAPQSADDDAEGVNSPPPLTDVASWPDMSAAAGAAARGRASSTAAPVRPPPAASGSGQGAPPAQSPASRASSRTKKQKWVQIAPSELQAAADAVRSNANGARRAQRAGSQQPAPTLPPVPPLPASVTPIDDVFVVRPREQAQASNSASSVSGRTNTSTASSTSPSSSHASLGPPPPFLPQHARQTPSLSSSQHMSATGSDPQDAPLPSAKRVAPSQAGAVSVSGYKDLDSLSSAHGRVVLFGSIDALPDACQPEQTMLSPHPAHSDTQSQSESGAPVQTSPQDPLAPPNQPAMTPHSDTNPVPAFASLSISPQAPYDPSLAAQQPWYVHPQQEAWQVPASAWQHVNGSIPELTAPLSEEAGEPRPLSEADRTWSGSSWTGQHAQLLQTPQLGSHYPDATNSPVHSPYYYQVPPRHAHQYHSSSHHWSGEYTSPLPYDSWEDRPPRERRTRESERDNIFEVDYSRMSSDRRPRDRDRYADRERDRENAGTAREKDTGTGPRPRRNSTADRGFYSGARRGRSHSQPLDGGSSRGRGGYRGGYHRHERAHAGASARALSPETPYWAGSSGARAHGPRQQSHPGELPLPVPHTVIPAGAPMDPTRYFVLGQIEYYFGARNLATDFWLRQQMDSRGWIPIALVASFNRVRALTASPALVREVMEVSALLEVRGDRVRLRDAQWKAYVTPDAARSADDSSDDEDARVEAALRRPATGDGDEDDSDDDIVFVLSVDEPSVSSRLQAPAP